MTTGDQGVIDDDGYFTFVGRDDDVITSAGYRIGPGEIEDCLIQHPAVALAAVIGKPDPVRTEIVKAFIVLKSGQAQVGRARRRHPGVRAHASVGARISARDRLHRRDADDHDRQGDPAVAAGEGVSVAERRKSDLALFLLRSLLAENRVPVVLVGLGDRLLALAPAVVLRRRGGGLAGLGLGRRGIRGLAGAASAALGAGVSAALAGAGSAALAGAAAALEDRGGFLGSGSGFGFLLLAIVFPDADCSALIRRAARWRQG